MTYRGTKSSILLLPARRTNWCREDLHSTSHSRPLSAPFLRASRAGYTSPYRDVMRAKVVLMAADGLENKTIGERLDLPRQIVSKWRRRFFEELLPGLEERPRSGRSPFFPPDVVAVKAIACVLASNLG